MAINNPYVPGDPYSYDLKWMVNVTNDLQSRVSSLDAAIQDATDQADRAEDEADRAVREADRSRDEADRSANEADDAADEALKSEGHAVGEQGGVPVTSGSPYYQNNSKYYSQQSASSAQEAADYAAHIADPVAGLVTTWLSTHITQPSTPPIDTSLTVAGAAADAKAAGDAVREMAAQLNGYGVIAPGDYEDGHKFILPPTFAAGKTLVYNFTAKNAEAGFLGIYDSTDTRVHLIGRPSASGAEVVFSGTYVLPADFAYVLVGATNNYQQDPIITVNDIHLVDSYLVPRTDYNDALTDIDTLEQFVNFTGIVPGGKYEDATVIMTPPTFEAGKTIVYDFSVGAGEAGVINFQDGAGTLIGQLGRPGASGGAVSFAGTYTIPATFARAVVGASANYQPDPVLQITDVHLTDSYVVPRTDLDAWTVIEPTYLNATHDAQGRQSFTTTKFCSSLFLKIPSKKIRVTFASPWTVNVVSFDRIKYILDNGDYSGWKTAGTYAVDTAYDNVLLMVSKVGYNTDITPNEVAAAITVEIIGDLVKTGLSDRVLATIGDSITYGTDPANDPAQIANPWPITLANRDLFGDVLNYGVPSARVLNYPTPNPPPAAWSQDYVNVPEISDVVCVMAGLNDMASAKAGYAGYVLGTMDDRTPTTFYGGLHTMWQGLLLRFPPSSGKKLFMINYPYLPYFSAEWADWMGACKEVAEYYGIPILDLEKELGISVAGDPNHDYWIITGGEVNAHPTQTLADVFSEVIANFIVSHFDVK